MANSSAAKMTSSRSTRSKTVTPTTRECGRIFVSFVTHSVDRVAPAGEKTNADGNSTPTSENNGDAGATEHVEETASNGKTYKQSCCPILTHVIANRRA